MCVDCSLNLAPGFLFTNKVLLKHGILIYLYVYPWLLWGLEQLNSYNRGLLTLKAQNIYYLALYKKSYAKFSALKDH